MCYGALNVILDTFESIERKQCTLFSDVMSFTPRVFCLDLFFVFPCQPSIKVPVVWTRSLCSRKYNIRLNLDFCRLQAKKNVKGKGKAKGKGKGKAKSNCTVPKNLSPLANKGTKGRSKKGGCVRSQKGRVKATKAGGGGRGSSAREYALERRRALEAMWSSCEEDDDEYGSSDGEVTTWVLLWF